MTTAAVIVDRAFRRIGVKAEDTALSADEAQHGLEVFNSMMAALRLDGINYTHAAMDSEDEFMLGGEFISPLVNMLAFELAPDYSTAAQVDYDRARRLLQTAMPMPVPDMTIDRALLRRSPMRGGIR